MISHGRICLTCRAKRKARPAHPSPYRRLGGRSPENVGGMKWVVGGWRGPSRCRCDWRQKESAESRPSPCSERNPCLRSLLCLSAASTSSTSPENIKRARVMTHLGDLMSASPCNSVPLCAAAIAFPSNTRDAPGNESGLGERRSRGEREERREKRGEREEKGGADEVVEERETQEEEKKKLRRRPIDELREFAGWFEPDRLRLPLSGRKRGTVQYPMDSRTRE